MKLSKTPRTSYFPTVPPVPQMPARPCQKRERPSLCRLQAGGQGGPVGRFALPAPPHAARPHWVARVPIAALLVVWLLLAAPVRAWQASCGLIVGGARPREVRQGIRRTIARALDRTMGAGSGRPEDMGRLYRPSFSAFLPALFRGAAIPGLELCFGAAALLATAARLFTCIPSSPH
ncbi:unnamed protein product [Amoebophrya sp. A120]|nr:unnamed protein product [Amoebophrya sp. A120]|eukprot:GSA120T00012891001.1